MIKCIKSTFIPFILLASPTFSSALTSGGYLDTKKSTAGSDQFAKVAEVTIKAYHQGMAESFQILAMANENKLHFSNVVQACVPDPAVLTHEMISTAITQTIGSPEKRKEIPSDMKELPVAVFALIGLSRIFPCK